MTKRVFFLMGVAIFSVVIHQATSWGYTAMMWWTDRYRPVTVPNFDQVGTLPYYVTMAIRQLTVFCVPAFVFVTGFFLVYAARGSQATLSWKMVRTRVVNLAIPYLIWSVVIWVADAFQGKVHAPVEYLRLFVTVGADAGYYFVPLLCQLYLISPLLAPIAKNQGRWLLVVTALLQASIIGLLYLTVFLKESAPVVEVLRSATTHYICFRWLFFFSLGMVSGTHLQELGQWLARLKRVLPMAVVVLGVLGIVETELVFHLIGADWRGNPHLISTNLYSIACILCFLAFEEIRIPFPEFVNQLASRSYGIYLLHGKVMEFFSRVIRQVAPWMLARQALFQPVLSVFGLAIPLLFMAVVARFLARRLYAVLFS